jgi:protein gp37
MGETTTIAWTDHTFNPWTGCTKVGPGCDGCYAEVWDQRFSKGAHWGPGAPRQRTSEANWRQPIKWNEHARAIGKPAKVFCASLADVFDNEVPDDWRRNLFELWAATPWLRWQVLTKRIGNARAMLEHCPGWPLPNVGLVATVVNQDELERDAPKLHDTPARWRGLSIEPQIGPVWLWENDCGLLRGPVIKVSGGVTPSTPDNPPEGYDDSYPWIDWVITGGESKQPGHQPRAYRVSWARGLVRQCRELDIPLFVKQLGAWPVADDGRLFLIGGNDNKARGQPEFWPEDLRVRQFPDAVLS